MSGDGLDAPVKGELLDMMSVHDNRIPPMGPAFQEPSLLMGRENGYQLQLQQGVGVGLGLVTC